MLDLGPRKVMVILGYWSKDGDDGRFWETDTRERRAQEELKKYAWYVKSENSAPKMSLNLKTS